ncbi:MAG: conserved membrane protein of unknown function [Promethearchaeota archaeon]|nr:MAG: conserved membrane protein of unknown function [Candidatus Lokiarchaeota archaeon]
MFILQAFDFIEWISTPLGSTYFIFFLSIGISLLSAGLTKLLVDTDELQRKQKQIKEHYEEKERIINLAEENVDRYHKEKKKWERKDAMLQKTQQGMAMQRLKPTCITFVPILVLFGILRTLYYVGGIPLPVAATPMNANDIPLIGNFVAAHTGEEIYEWTALVYGTARVLGIEAGWINFTGWYFLCSLGMNTLLQRLFGLQTQASGGMEQMTGGPKAKSMEFPDI